MYVIGFCGNDFIIPLIKIQVSEHHKDFSKAKDIFEVVAYYSVGSHRVPFLQKILIKLYAVFSVAVNTVSDTEKFLQAGLLESRKLQELFQRLQMQVEVKRSLSLEREGDIMDTASGFQIRGIEMFPVIGDEAGKIFYKC